MADAGFHWKVPFINETNQFPRVMRCSPSVRSRLTPATARPRPSVGSLSPDAQSRRTSPCR
ncbi:hypothetical protein [Agrobacterium pusense]|uniref:hypothetical protein n=1 Tax=Agrobacterium pusense TaxID=648995 RepID=UPI0031F37F44